MLEDEVNRLAEKILLAEKHKNHKLAAQIRWTIGPTSSAALMMVNIAVRKLRRPPKNRQRLEVA